METQTRRYQSASNQILARFICACLFVALIACLTVFRQQPPDVVNADAPLDVFASGRAMKHLHAIAAAPHPIGSRDHARVREYISGVLAEAGLETQHQKTTVMKAFANETVVADVQNIVARLPGTDPASRAIVLAAHYDSVPNSPGASDDGSGVVVLLETLRALRASQPLKQNIIFLFTDGEEIGLLGAKAFVDHHPWAKDIDFVLNFEARGSGGPVFMFETSGDNRRLIDGYSRVASHPFATSLMYTIYRLLPNSTDFTIFRQAGMSGMNFAFIDGVSRYHAPSDSLSTIDERSVQHGGSHALALTKFFGSEQPDLDARGNVVYFDVWGKLLVSYARSWTFPLLLVLSILYGLTIATGHRKRLVTFRGLAVGFASLVLSLVGSALVATLLWWVVVRLHRGYAPLTSSRLFFLSFVFLSVAVVSAIFLRFSRRNSVYSLSLGALLLWFLAAVATVFLLPGASYVFIWPLLFTLIGLLLAMLLPASEQGNWRSLAILSLGVLPGLMLMIGTTHNIFLSINLSLPAALVVLNILTLGLLVPFLMYVPARLKWRWPTLTLILSMALLVAGSMARTNGNQFPRSNSLAYEFRSNSGESFWISHDRETDEWTSQFFSQEVGAPVSTSPLFPAHRVSLSAKAPPLKLSGPQLDVIEDRISNGVRVTRLRLMPPADARVLNIQAEPSTTVVAATINGERLRYDSQTPGPGQQRGWELSYFAVPANGFELIVETLPDAPLKVTLSAFSDGLPTIALALLKTRPAHLMPARFSDMTSVVKTFDLGAFASSSVTRTDPHSQRR